jgi:cytosine/adenosine deaminase-related metal-dependent hydrolase
VRAARRAASHLTVHVAEVEEELRLLRAGDGPFRALLRSLGRWPRRHTVPRCSPVEWLRRAGALGPRTLLVHLQEATGGDLDLVARSRAPVVVCPPTIEWFGRTAPDVPGWRRAGVRVALGTDSPASSDAPLSMVDAMARARQHWSELHPDAVLAMATVDAARAIGRPALGRIAAGARGDLCAFALPRAMVAAAALDAATAGALPVAAVWSCGRPVHGSGRRQRHACAVPADALPSAGSP